MAELLSSDSVVYILPVLLTGLGWLFRKLYRERLGFRLINRLGGYARLAVLGTHAEYVAAIKRGRADGVLTDDERKEARALALAKLRSYADLDRLADIIGGDAAEELAGDAVESAIREAKAGGSLPTSASV